ncbi:MAG: hypothetical protein U0229_11395 [Anaeromyxobacter sp.]
MLALVAAMTLLSAPPELLGTWKGTSTCLRPAAGPACKDEVVVYRCTALPRGAVKLDAFKIVDGQEVPMFDLDLGRAADGWWTAEFRNARVHILWWFRASGDALEGKLEDFDTHARLRVVQASRAGE